MCIVYYSITALCVRGLKQLKAREGSSLSINHILITCVFVCLPVCLSVSPCLCSWVRMCGDICARTFSNVHLPECVPECVPVCVLACVPVCAVHAYVLRYIRIQLILYSFYCTTFYSKLDAPTRSHPSVTNILVLHELLLSGNRKNKLIQLVSKIRMLFVFLNCGW